MDRMDISMEVSPLSSFIAMPREGHMQQVLHIFAYLKVYHNARIVFDPTYPELEENEFEIRGWGNMYGVGREDIPESIPEPLGNEFMMRAFVDASFARCKLIRRSRPGFIVYLNCVILRSKYSRGWICGNEIVL